MKRKIIGAAAAYMSGLFFASFFSDIYGLMMLCGVAMAVMAAGLKRRFSLVDLVMIAVCFVTAFGVSTAYTRLTYDRIVGYGGMTGTFSGKVTDFDIYDRDYAEYTLKGTINGEIKANIRLRTNELDASYGDIVRAEDCKFAVPENTYLFKSADHYRSKHIYLTASGGGISVEHTNSGLLRRALADFRSASTERFLIRLGRECGGALAGMVFGEKDYIDRNMKTSLYRTGIGHILAVSGLHVSIVCAAVMAMLRKLRVNKYLSFGIVNVILVLLIIMANSPISAVRAALMLDIMYSARLFRQQNDPLNSLSIAALLIGIADPYCVFSGSFLLSFTGTFGIAVLGPYVTEKMSSETRTSRWRNRLIIALCTTLAVFPASAYLFDEVSVISPISNLLLVPLCAAAMLIGLLDVVTLGLLPVLPAAGALIGMVIGVSDGISSFGGSYISVSGDIVTRLMLNSAMAAAVIFLYTGSRRKLVAILTAVMVLCAGVNTAAAVGRSRQCRVAVLGKSTDAAAVISYMGHTTVIDLSGSTSTDEYVRKYIAVNGTHPDRLILTENQPSRYPAYLDALAAFEPDEILTTEEIGSDFYYRLGDCGFSFCNGTLCISYLSSSLVITTAGAEPEDSITVFYGRIPAEEPVSDNCYYLADCGTSNSGRNNIEFILTGDGQGMVRRM